MSFGEIGVVLNEVEKKLLRFAQQFGLQELDAFAQPRFRLFSGLPASQSPKFMRGSFADRRNGAGEVLQIFCGIMHRSFTACSQRAIMLNPVICGFFNSLLKGILIAGERPRKTGFHYRRQGNV